MKHVKWIFVVLLLCSLTSFVDFDVVVSELKVGNSAPNFSIKSAEEGRTKTLKELEGNYVLLSFWASYDALSREQNALLSNALKKTGYAVRMVSVSFDEYQSIFNGTIKKDGIDTPDCFVETSGEASDIYKAYRLDKGFQNYLLDKDGVIIAKNVTADKLSQYID